MAVNKGLRALDLRGPVRGARRQDLGGDAMLENPQVGRLSPVLRWKSSWDLVREASAGQGAINLEAGAASSAGKKAHGE